MWRLLPPVFLVSCAGVAPNETVNATAHVLSHSSAQSLLVAANESGIRPSTPPTHDNATAAGNSTTTHRFQAHAEYFLSQWNRTRTHLVALIVALSLRMRAVQLTLAARLPVWGRQLQMRAIECAHELAAQMTMAMSRTRIALIKSARSRRDGVIRAARRRRLEVIEEWRRFRRRDPAVSRILRHAATSDWYALLQVRRRASQPQLRSAYRQMAKRVHPDKTRDDRAAQAFDVLRDTFDLLSDGDKRKRYDAQLAERDRQMRLRRERQRRAAMRAAERTLRSASIVMWENKRVTLGVALALYLRFGLEVGVDPALQALPARPP